MPPLPIARLTNPQELFCQLQLSGRSNAAE
jgi:hypothetical protein